MMALLLEQQTETKESIILPRSDLLSNKKASPATAIPESLYGIPPVKPASFVLENHPIDEKSEIKVFYLKSNGRHLLN
jgi:hypothetical protein